MPEPSSEPSRNLVADWTFGADSSRSSRLGDSLFATFPPQTGEAEPAHGRAPGAGGEGHLADTVDLGANKPEHASIVRPSTAPGPEPIVPPKPGEMIGGFLIVSELGRGAFARVYLAEQPSLSHRLVALKVSRVVGEEPQMLARLQHTHIVPIFSVHDDPATRLRLICMPYLGGANLAQVLEAVGARLPAEATGRSLVEALDLVSHRFVSELGFQFEQSTGLKSLSRQHGTQLAPLLRSQSWDTAHDASRQVLIEPVRNRSFWGHLPAWKRAAPAAPEPSPVEDDGQPARQFLRTADSIEAAVWIIARLAEGLDHAHSRGLLHRDLKPSNILIAADGTPMLLDFNLSTNLLSEWTADGGGRAMLGGTLPYMSPEHLEAFERRDARLAQAVDERSDLYALGLILFEMIAGVHPFVDPPASLPLSDVPRFMIAQRQRVPSLRQACPRVPWGLDAIVAKCLALDPDQRYDRARDLAEDLRRFLEDLPLKFAPEPSVRERFVKWARRHPRLCSMSSIATLAIVLLLALGTVMGMLARNFQQASARLKWHHLQSDFDGCQFLLNTVSGPADHLGRGIALAERTLAEHFDERGRWRPGDWVKLLGADEQAEVRARLAELILLDARARTYLAGRARGTSEWREAREWAVRWLDRAERIDVHPPAALFSDRAEYLADLGMTSDAVADRSRAAKTSPATSRDFALRGTALLAGGDPTRAEVDLRRAVNLDPRSFWAWFTLGHCYYEQGRYADAAGAFGACTALRKEFAWPHMNRGLALAQAGRLIEALECYDQAVANDPRFAEAFVNRALTALELDRLDDAERDLHRALALGRNGAGVYAALGEVLYRLGRTDEAERLYGELLRRDPNNLMALAARGIFRLTRDPRGARADLEKVLRRDPRHARARYGLARLLYREDPSAALVHVNAALDAEPKLIDALVLRMLLRARGGDLAALDDADRLRLSPTPHHLYNAACAVAVLAESAREPKLVPRAFAALNRALDAGFPADEVESDPDWAPYRTRPEFRALVQKAKRTPPA